MAVTDWIKLRKCLYSHPKVAYAARVTAMSEEQVVGWFGKVWSWADDATEDGVVQFLTLADVQRLTLIPEKLIAAMRQVGWIVESPDGISFPGWDEHLSSGAKKRAEDAKRKRNSRVSEKCPKNSGQKSDQTRSDQTRSETYYVGLSDLITDTDRMFSVFCEEKKLNTWRMTEIAHRKLGLTFDPKQTGFLGKAATLVVAGHLPEARFWDAVEGARLARAKHGKPVNRVGYFRKVLEEKKLPARGDYSQAGDGRTVDYGTTDCQAVRQA